MIVRPISRNAAMAFLAEHHRHLRRRVTGWLFGCQLVSTIEPGKVLGIACAGRPASRMLQDGETLEITRVATLGDPNACSRLYGALRRAGQALGYTRFVTYTREDEPGVSPRAAGFRCEGPAGGGEATRPSRPRRASEDPSPKVRWVFP